MHVIAHTTKYGLFQARTSVELFRYARQIFSDRFLSRSSLHIVLSSIKFDTLSCAKTTPCFTCIISVFLILVCVCVCVFVRVCVCARGYLYVRMCLSLSSWATDSLTCLFGPTFWRAGILHHGGPETTIGGLCHCVDNFHPCISASIMARMCIVCIRGRTHGSGLLMMPVWRVFLQQKTRLLRRRKAMLKKRLRRRPRLRRLRRWQLQCRTRPKCRRCMRGRNRHEPRHEGNGNLRAKRTRMCVGGIWAADPRIWSSGWHQKKDKQILPWQESSNWLLVFRLYIF